ncbi:GspE/PulE family protein [Pontibacter sp. G13]|uniref:GspE/PulE family protein n=1 Tax=Pontibacter sp. G13 TaxID=3074898 RepID=UPI0028893DB5|nr:GspE/PulE family protein [Pontibacter sp. G13]WNJ21619.1 GspE/PulE family protein [Pontibacter sp. G13]
MMVADIDIKWLSLLTPQQAYTYRAIPCSRESDTELRMIVQELPHPHASQLSMLFGDSLEFDLVSPEEMDELLARHYIWEELEVPMPKVEPVSQVADSDVAHIVQQAVSEAVKIGASDIHIERYATKARVRFRWQGQLIEKYELALEQYNAIVSRIKILAELDIAEKRLPQDGRIPFEVDGVEVDSRVSTMPAKFGEKVVLRLLVRSDELLELDRIGMEKIELQMYRKTIRNPNGIILITGPTGSGKTTTLYATLKDLNVSSKNILTLEDPIEYNFPGINQTQVHSEIGFDFATGLKHFLRQDPDIIMLGEIRDPETAKVAFRAAMTGHMVFSTLHTNSTWESVSRLCEMGVEPYQVSAALRLVISQRLIRLLCRHCREASHDVRVPGLQDMYGIVQHYTAVGCPKCHFTGYSGRKAVFELMPVNAELASRIRDRGVQPEGYLSQFEIPTFEENLAKLVIQGETSLEELSTMLMG